MFFEGAMQSGGAFKIVKMRTGQVAGSTGFNYYYEADSSVYISYVFYGTAYLGNGLNQSVKALMLDYIFQFVDRVLSIL